MSSDDKPRRFARAVAMLLVRAQSLRAVAERSETDAQALALVGAGWPAERMREEATECEAAAALLEAAEGETT
jgi:hypothetical protein